MNSTLNSNKGVLQNSKVVKKAIIIGSGFAGLGMAVALKKFNIDRTDLLDPCKSIYVSAWLVRKKMNKYGNTWKAYGAYHSETPEYQEKYVNDLKTILRSWSVIN